MKGLFVYSKVPQTEIESNTGEGEEKGLCRFMPCATTHRPLMLLPSCARRYAQRVVETSTNHSSRDAERSFMAGRLQRIPQPHHFGLAHISRSMFRRGSRSQLALERGFKPRTNRS